MRQKLTNRFIRDIRPSAKDALYWDDGGGSVKGLGLKVRPSGKKTLVFQYRVGAGRAGKSKQITLGEPSPVLNLERARVLASEHRLTVNAGGDPAEIVRKAKEAVRRSSERAFDTYLETFLEHAHRTLRSAGEVERILRKEFLPHWRGCDIADLGRVDIRERLNVIMAADKPYLANKCLGVIGMFFSYAANQGEITASPAAGMRAPFKRPPTGRDRFLSDNELVKVWKAAGEEPQPYGPYIRFLILVPARRGELAGMNQKEFDCEVGLWEVPAERSKNGKPVILPLPPMAWNIIDNQPKHKSGLLFTKRGNNPISGFSKLKLGLDERLDGVESWHLHDLRRTFATGLARLGIDEKVTELCLNHVPKQLRGVAAVYNKFDYLEQKAKTLSLWADHVLGLVTAADAENCPASAPLEQTRVIA